MKIWQFVKKEAVLSAALLAAVISMFFVPPSLNYIDYIDFRTLALLLALMLTVAGAKKAGAFEILISSCFSRAKDRREIILMLVSFCFFSSMLITNDVALITFVPPAIMVFGAQLQTLMITIVLMTVAANLGSMLTPVGNPQNLFLFSRFEMSIGEFFSITAPITAASALILLIAIMMLKNDAATIKCDSGSIDTRKLLPWTILFMICLACVGRIIDYRLMLVIVLAAVFFVDRQLLKEADYSLLITFVAFFIFVGNMQNMPAVKKLLKDLVVGREFAASILLSQVISNVPAAVMLSGFCDDGAALLAGVNIGGLGTPIASMASLISYKQFAAAKNADTGKYMVLFLTVNITMLSLLIIAHLLIN